MHHIFQTGKCFGTDPANGFRQENRAEYLLGVIRTLVDLLQRTGRNNRVALRNVEEMTAHRQLFRLCRGQDIIKLLHQLRNRADPRLGEQTLFRPMHLRVRTEQEEFHDFTLRIAVPHIDVGQTAGTGKRIRLHFRQRRRDLNRHQARCIPERLSRNAPNALGNLKPLPCLCFTERTVTDYGIFLQRCTALLRSGHRFGDFTRKHTVIRAVLSEVQRNKGDRLVKALKFRKLKRIIVFRSRLLRQSGRLSLYGRLLRQCGGLSLHGRLLRQSGGLILHGRLLRQSGGLILHSNLLRYRRELRLRFRNGKERRLRI